MITTSCTLAPAYGRDYNSAGAVVDDFLHGKDFKVASVGIPGGRYCSLRDFAAGVEVTLRYSKLSKATSYVVLAGDVEGRKPAPTPVKADIFFGLCKCSVTFEHIDDALLFEKLVKEDEAITGINIYI